MTVREARLAALARMRERARGAGADARGDADRPVAARLAALLAGEPRPRPRRCSRSPTATWACAARTTRACRPTTRRFFLNGFHETWPIPYGEAAFGFATTGQTIVSAPDGSVMRLYVDEEPLVLASPSCSHYERVLDMRSGMLERSARFRTARGAVVQLRSQRLVSLHWRHLAAISYEVTLLSGQAELAIASELVTHLPRPKGDDDPRVGVRMDRLGARSRSTQFCDGTRVAARAAHALERHRAWPAAWSTASRPSCATASSPASRRTRAASCSSSTPSPASRRA